MTTITTTAYKSSRDTSGDWLDNVCVGASHAFCPLPEQKVIAAVDTTPVKPEDQDILDHVFTRVESLSFGGDEEDQRNTTTGSSGDGDGNDAIPAVVGSVTSTSAVKEQSSSSSNKKAQNDAKTSEQQPKGILMQEGDLLDVVFEKVESFVCANEDNTDDAHSLVAEDEVAVKVSEEYSDGHPEIQSGGTSTSIETELEEENKKIDNWKQDAWYKKPTCQICAAFACLVIAALVVNGVLYFTRWNE